MYQFINNPTINLIIIEVARTANLTVSTPRIKQASPAALALLGYSADDLLDQPLAIIYDAKNQSAHWQAAIANLTDQTTLRFKSKLLAKSSQPIEALICLSVLASQPPKTTDIALIFQAITNTGQTTNTELNLDYSQCKATESALSESEERFRQMAEMTGEWLWEQDPAGYYIYSSVAVKQILGYDKDEVVGKHYTEFLTAQDKAEQQDYAAIHRPFYGLTNHLCHKDGHPVFTESTGLPIISKDGKLIKWRGVDHDITAKKQFQDALIESEQRTRLIIESSLSAIVMMDAAGLITDWNPQAEKMFGWPRQKAIGQPLATLIIPARFHNAHRQGLQLFLQTGMGPILNQVIEHVAVRRDGAEFPIELSVSPLKQNNTYSFSGFIHDISSRKATEATIREAQVSLAIAHNEIKIAQRIQASLSPALPIQSDALEVVGFCLPANQVGGDYFDYFFQNNDCLNMIIADVSGHSIGPALFMVEARSAIRTLASNANTPAATLATLNNFLFADLNKTDYFISLFYLQYDASKRLLRFANAGHPSPLLLSPFQSVCRRLDADGLILGINKDEVFEEKVMALAKGDLILLYTDGIIEAENPTGDFFGMERLSEVFIQQANKSPQKIISALLEQLKQFCQTETFNDDVTLMVFKCG
ncbi:MAG: SpoIIE family protein phosphatase [Methylovulum sp.]|nr:SpoIIE family protein phosphatase [Methylovulum sp.]